ncbi:SLAC1 family transporter [Streptomyces chartreusis]
MAPVLHVNVDDPEAVVRAARASRAAAAHPPLGLLPPPGLLRDARSRPDRDTAGPSHGLRPPGAPPAPRCHRVDRSGRAGAGGDGARRAGHGAAGRVVRALRPWHRGARATGRSWCGASPWSGWPSLATGLTIRAGLPTAPTWWSFIFPVGVCVTATGTLTTRTGSAPLIWTTAVLYTALVLAWLVVAGRSLRPATRHVRRPASQIVD